LGSDEESAGFNLMAVGASQAILWLGFRKPVFVTLLNDHIKFALNCPNSAQIAAQSWFGLY
jgi:hypothetical protein